jgi:imidazolonepropionase-like amidohydrolase
MRRFAFSVALLASGLCLSQALSAPPETTLAFVDVTVVPMDSERTLPGQTVVVRGDRIAELGPSRSVQIPKQAVRVDGTGKYLMPGLTEMHAHIPGGQASDAMIERVLLLFVAKGVTTVRGMLGDPRHLPLRARLSKGELVGPTLYTSGPSLNGTSVPTAEVAVKMVADQKAAGYDFLKIHPGIKRDVFDALVAEAERQHIPFAGHVPVDVGLMRALEARYRSIDHVDGFVEALVKDGAPVDPKSPGFFGLALVEHLDESRIPRLVAATKAAGVWVIPTQNLFELFLSSEQPEALAARPEMTYLPADTVKQWISQRQQFLSQAGFTPEKARRLLEIRRRIIKALHDGGVDLALGSDAIQVFSVPGYSLHGELLAMVKCGLTPYQAYAMGSRNVARYFGIENEVGTVAAGKRADLVLLDADPLADVTHFSRQAGVMVRGRWLPRSEIDTRLAALAASR